MPSSLERLQKWYASQTQGNWDTSGRIVIQSIENPGWMVKINLAGTPLQGRTFAEVSDGLDPLRETDWFSAYIELHDWKGFGDESKLERILNCFLDWAEVQ